VGAITALQLSCKMRCHVERWEENHTLYGEARFMRLILSWLLAMIFCCDCARLLAEDQAVAEGAAIQKTVDAYVASFTRPMRRRWLSYGWNKAN